MFRERDFPIEQPSPPDSGSLAELVDDLELQTVWDGMAGGDTFLAEVARAAMLSGLGTVDEIRYRQHVLDDCVRESDVVREIYRVAVDAIAAARQVYRSVFSNYGDAMLRHAVGTIEALLGMLKQLRAICAAEGDRFRSPGFRRFFDQVRAELDDSYLAEVETQLKTLRFREGVLVSAQLGDGNRGTGYVLRNPRPANRAGWFNRTPIKKPTFQLTITDRDEAGFRALGELRDRGIDLVASALAEASDHVLNFFIALRTELGFYIGALNLYERLTERGEPTCMPDPDEPPELRLVASELYDPCLVLRTERAVVGNDIDADGKYLVIVTGANQGGKSTFLRSLGIAHLMMQCGMFVTASSFRSTLTTRVLTHYKREEDAGMTKGKFEEELARMSRVVDAIEPGALLLCNESFAATNEREGSQVGREVTRAMTDAGVRVVYVTHMFDLAHGFVVDGSEDTLLLRADRGEQAHRTFRLTPGEPLPTSFGEDIYRKAFDKA